MFPADNGGHLQPSTLYRHWYKARAAAGRPDLRLHDLRHSGAVLAAATGASLAELMARLGHSHAAGRDAIPARRPGPGPGDCGAAVQVGRERLMTSDYERKKRKFLRHRRDKATPVTIVCTNRGDHKRVHLAPQSCLRKKAWLRFQRCCCSANPGAGRVVPTEPDRPAPSCMRAADGRTHPRCAESCCGVAVFMPTTAHERRELTRR